MQAYIQIDYVETDGSRKTMVVTQCMEEAYHFLFILNVASKKVLNREAFIASVITYDKDDYRGNNPTILIDNVSLKQLADLDIDKLDIKNNKGKK